jgi:hypothetical protein
MGYASMMVMADGIFGRVSAFQLGSVFLVRGKPVLFQL